VNGTLSKVFIFAAGAAVGSVVTWKILKTKYERLAQEEIDSVKEVYEKRYVNRCEPTSGSAPDETTIDEEPVEGESDPVTVEYEDILADNGYTTETTPTKKEATDTKKPYVIAPEDFGENDDYEITSLTYYADGILTDDADDPIDDIDLFVGKESLTHFGEYEDDSVYVRNDKFKCDYEILLDSRNYSDLYQRTE
jgi:hypothetical protein